MTAPTKPDQGLVLFAVAHNRPHTLHRWAGESVERHIDDVGEEQAWDEAIHLPANGIWIAKLRIVDDGPSDWGGGARVCRLDASELRAPTAEEWARFVADEYVMLRWARGLASEYKRFDASAGVVMSDVVMSAPTDRTLPEPTELESPEAICPWCGEVQSDTWDLGLSDGEHEDALCGSCEKPIRVKANVCVDYTTYALGTLEAPSPSPQRPASSPQRPAPNPTRPYTRKDG